MSRPNKVRTLFRFVLGFPLTAIAILFIGGTIVKNYSHIVSQLHSVNIPLLLLGIVLLTSFFALKAHTWMMLLRLLGHKVGYLRGSYLLTISEIRRYIPGNIFGFISRAHNYSGEKIPQKTTYMAIGLESLLLLIPSFVVSIPSIVYFWEKLASVIPSWSIYTGVALCLLGGLAAWYLLRRKFGTSAYKTFVKKNIWGVLDILLLNAFAWILYGIGNYCLSASIVYINPVIFLQISSLFVLAWMVGYLSLITPMGLGVREAVIVVGLSNVVTSYMASYIAVLLRVYFIMAELLFLLVVATCNAPVLQPIVKGIKRLNAPGIVAIAYISYVLYFSFLTIQKHNNFFTGRFDLGNMDQTVWNSLHGKLFLFTNPDSTETISRIAFHADVILVLLAPLYLIWSDPRMLLVFQTAVLGLGAFYVYKLSETVIKDKAISVAFALSFLLNPYVQRQNMYDFHAVVLATTFLIAAFYYIEKKRWVLMGIFLLLAALTKENIYLITTLIGIYLMIRKQYKLGAAIASVSLATFFIIMKKIIPAVRGSSHFALVFLSEFGDSTTEIAKNILLHPVKTIDTIIANKGPLYLFQLLLPVGFVALLAPLFLLFAGPDTLKNLLASNYGFRSLHYQYNAEILPFIFIASVYGVHMLITRFKLPIMKRLAFYWILGFAIFAQWQYGPLPGAYYASLEIYTRPLPYASEVRGYLKTLPPDARIAATNNLGAHLSQREYIYVVPVGIEQADYVLFLLTDKYAQPSLTGQREMVQNLLLSNQYTLEYRVGEFYAFKLKQHLASGN